MASGSLQVNPQFSSLNLLQEKYQSANNLLDETSSNFSERLDVAQMMEEKKEKVSQIKEMIQRNIDQRPENWSDQGIAKSYSESQENHIEKMKAFRKQEGEHASRMLKIQEKALASKEKAPKQNTPEKNSPPPKNETFTAPKAETANLRPATASESFKVMTALHQISQMTKVQSPNLQKVSDQLASLIKNSPVAKGGEGLRSENASSPTSEKDKAVKSKEKIQKPTATKGSEYSEKIEEMKEKVVQQVRFKLQMAVRKGIGNVNVQLNPQMLGHVSVQLNINSSNVMAKMFVDNNTVKEMITGGEESLREALSERGMDLHSLDVEVSNNEEEGNNSGRSFSSIEDRRAAREWINSFHRPDHEQEEYESDESHTLDGEIITTIDENQLLDIKA